ncbi:YbfB/YjiJ family MFS transporter [Chelatococcus sambhunathii]|uniref:YbfB/YjiJ family MFS transporter n=1 Tax=Chelatococcus sambhunathii TaxID=363953 RepID=A0ABU1DC89_9HYPH|nr:YbfB/YjiJ family MFS transporter [Chelatococcus sambhunathii]MDR4305730.1 YbfB/YjiJ family MFS transporter [Chelatococcus sambhunathii]
MALLESAVRPAAVNDLPAPAAPQRVAPAPAEAMTSLWVVAGLAMAPAVAQGFGRFAYALVLPAMRDDLGWSYADAGAMGTANAIGYLGGAVVAARLAERFGARRIFAWALVAAALSIAATALPSGWWTQGALRIFTGLASGIAFVVGGALAAAAAAGGGAARAPTVLGVYVAGVGAGVALSALAVPPLVAEAGWRGGWVALGLLSIVAALLAAPAIRRTPEPRSRPHGSRSAFALRPILFEMISYGLLGAGYIAYATFVIAHLKIELGFTPIEVSAFWTVLGLSIVAFTFAWGPILGRLRGGFGLVATSGVMTAGVLLVLLEPTRPGAYASAMLFGASGLAAVTAVTTLARRIFPPEAWTSAIGALTVAFGVGQIVGPVLSGIVSDGPHGLAAGLWLSIGILAAAIFVALLQREARA